MVSVQLLLVGSVLCLLGALYTATLVYKMYREMEKPLNDERAGILTMFGLLTLGLFVMAAIAFGFAVNISWQKEFLQKSSSILEAAYYVLRR